MSCQKSSSSLYRRVPLDIEHLLHRCLEEAAAKLQEDARVIVFFRADDIGVPGERFTKLVDLFRRKRFPLTLSVVPAWLTRPRWQQLQDLCGKDQRLWCWTQHGWRHVNHEPRGKKLEFGPSRTASRKREDLWLGFHRLREIMGEVFVPAFTPPWNRCDQQTLNALQGLGFQALSRNSGAQPPAPAKISEYSVSVDLHTRKELDDSHGWRNLCEELRDNLANGFCGIMLHHQRMNHGAFVFLELLLDKLERWNCGRFVHLGTLLEEGYKPQEVRC
jgi:peptidoglycan/xylan/chitin deacetylase (PgdA/CDA1 family)